MTSIEKHDQEIILALEHITKHPYGYIDELENVIDIKIIDEMISVGLLKCGYSGDGMTYTITTFGRDYYAATTTPTNNERTVKQKRDIGMEYVLQYIMTHRYGYMQDLDELGQPDVVSKMACVGIIKTGFAPKGKTYAITPFGIRYYNAMTSRKRSIIYRLFNREMRK